MDELDAWCFGRDLRGIAFARPGGAQALSWRIFAWPLNENLSQSRRLVRSLR
jgi:hypothetical protein